MIALLILSLSAVADTKLATAYVFLSARCPCSAAHEPALAELAKKHPEFEFVGVHSNADEPEAESREHFAKAGLPFRVVEDSGSKLANRFGALKTPHVFVVDAKDQILYQGGVDDSQHPASANRRYLDEALTALKAGKKPAEARTRALGCVIRR